MLGACLTPGPPPCPWVRHAQGKTKLARIKYQKALKLVDRAFDLDGDEQVAAASQLKASCLLNLARCAEREQEWGEALGWCNKAIRWAPGRRRGAPRGAPTGRRMWQACEAGHCHCWAVACIYGTSAPSCAPPPPRAPHPPPVRAHVVRCCHHPFPTHATPTTTSPCAFHSPCSEDDGYAKAYFRRAVIEHCLGDQEAAQADLALCAQLDPSTLADCERELARMERQSAAAEAKQRGALKGFFDR